MKPHESMFNKGFFRSELPYILFILIYFGAVAIWSVGSFDSRLANSIGDDHPIVLARIFNSSKNWKDDSGVVSALAFAVASLPNLLASLSGKSFPEAPRWLSWFYLLIQHIGLALAFFSFQKNFSTDKNNRLIGTLFCFFISPWTLNLAYYPNMIFYPYPGQLVLPFLIWAMSFLLQQRMFFMTLNLMLASLIHPSLALQTLGLCCFYIAARNRNSLSWRQFLFAIPVILASLVLPFGMVPKSDSPLTASQLLPSALKNPHLVPWNTPIFWPWAVPSIIGVFALGYLASQHFRKRSPNLFLFWKVACFTSALYGLVHLLAVNFLFLPIILLCPLRITALISCLLVPMVIQYLLELSQERSWQTLIPSISLLFFLVFSERGFFWGPTISLALLTLVPQTNSDKKALLTFMYWFLLFILAGAPLRNWLGSEASGTFRFWLAPGFSLQGFQIWFPAACACILAALIQFVPQYQKSVIGFFLLAGVGGIGLQKSHMMGRTAFAEPQASLLAVQRWAASHTSKNSVFLLEEGSWRGISQRQVVIIGYRPNGLLPYFKFPEPLAHENLLTAFYEKNGARKLSELSVEAIQELSDTFKAQYLVVKSQERLLSFPVVFENAIWRVYSLTNVGLMGSNQ